MPTKAKKPCKYPGCPRLTSNCYCELHEKEFGDSFRREYNSRYNKERRDRETAKKYNGQWKIIRELYAKAHPLCEECLKHGRNVPLKEVHHIIPLSRGGTHDFDNLMSLCKSCHEKKHIELGDRTPFAPRGV